MTILDDLWVAAIANAVDATPVDEDVPDFGLLGANDYKAHGMYFPPRRLTRQQLDEYRAGFEAAETEDLRLDEEWKRNGC